MKEYCFVIFGCVIYRMAFTAEEAVAKTVKEETERATRWYPGESMATIKPEKTRWARGGEPCPVEVRAYLGAGRYEAAGSVTVAVREVLSTEWAAVKAYEEAERRLKRGLCTDLEAESGLIADEMHRDHDAHHRYAHRAVTPDQPFPLPLNIRT